MAANPQNRASRRAASSSKPDPTLIEPGLYSVPAAAAWLSISQAQVWRLLEAGDLASVKCGRRRLIPREALTAYVDGLPAAS